MHHEHDRVRAHTSDHVNRRIDQDMECRIHAYEGRGHEEISQRIEELEEEWDIERWLQVNASALAIGGLLLGTTRARKWLMLPAVVLPFLMQHAVQGWCPPVSVFRRLGIRTRQEIEREKIAMRYLRGDFTDNGKPITSKAALKAAEVEERV